MFQKSEPDLEICERKTNKSLNTLGMKEKTFDDIFRLSFFLLTYSNLSFILYHARHIKDVVDNLIFVAKRFLIFSLE